MGNNLDWSKDFDFIEEAYGYSEPLTFTESSNSEIILESKGSEPSHFKILGKASGVFQTVGGYSRNKRYYTPEHWKIQLSNPSVQERLESRDIMGTLGHSANRPINDDDISKGLVSHLVTKLEIREDANGAPFLYGELEILDTPAGRILEAMYKGGANIFVSSRGAGKLEPMPNQIGIMRVNPQSYWFEGFDVVRRAGFIEAKPVFEDVTSETPSVSESHESSSFTDAQLHKKVQETKAQQKAPEAKATLKDFVADKEQANPIKDESSARFFTKQELKKETNEELETIKSQIQQLAGIVEKVVDSIYEKDEEPVQEENSDVKKSAILATLGLLSEANLSEEALIEIVEEIKKGI